jgi:hypothetical protein
MIARAALAAALAAACVAHAADAPAWPPPPEVQDHMHALQRVIIDPESTMAQREAAREELSGLLKSPAGQARGRTPDEKPPRPARAAIQPFPSVVKPLAPEAPVVPPSEVARVEVVEPPRPLVNPRTGAVLSPAAPQAGFAIDARTGQVLHPVPGGYVNPRTGQVIPH